MNWIDPKDRKPPANVLVLLHTPGFGTALTVGFWSPAGGGTWKIQDGHYSIGSVLAWCEIEPPKPPPTEPPTAEKLAKAMEQAVEDIYSFGHLCHAALAGDYYIKGKRYFVYVNLRSE